MDKKEREVIYRPRLEWKPVSGGTRWESKFTTENEEVIPLWIVFVLGLGQQTDRPCWLTYAKIQGEVIHGKPASYYTRRHTDELTRRAKTELLGEGMLNAEHILVEAGLMKPRPTVFVGMLADGHMYSNVHCGQCNAQGTKLNGCGKHTTTLGYWYYLRHPGTPDVELYGCMSSVHFCASCAPYYRELAVGTEDKLVVTEGGGCETIRERRQRFAEEALEVENG